MSVKLKEKKKTLKFQKTRKLESLSLVSSIIPNNVTHHITYSCHYHYSIDNVNKNALYLPKIPTSCVNHREIDDKLDEDLDGDEDNTGSEEEAELKVVNVLPCNVTQVVSSTPALVSSQSGGFPFFKTIDGVQSFNRYLLRFLLTFLQLGFFNYDILDETQKNSLMKDFLSYKNMFLGENIAKSKNNENRKHILFQPIRMHRIIHRSRS